MKKTFYSNGKLLLTGEYVVLDGAKALALPTKFGQYLHVEKGETQTITWKSYDCDNAVWFEATITYEEIKNKHTASENQVKNTLIAILHQAYIQNPDFLNETEGYQITTELTFPRLWGLGTSSTLINNIAQWASIDAFELLRKSFGGSGYDIACAQNDSPILYHLEDKKPLIEPVSFHPSFADQLYFVYLNQKQSSKTAIANYSAKRPFLGTIIESINQITDEVLNAEKATNFTELLQRHETLLSEVLDTKPVKEMLFPDFQGMVKSLGAWGGDFVLAISEKDPRSYFEEQGYQTILPYRDMIK